MKLPHIPHALDRLQSDATATLESGEEYLAALPIDPIGKHAAFDAHDEVWQAEGKGQLDVGAMVEKAFAGFQTKRDAKEFTDLVPANISFGDHGAIVAVTNQRLLVFGRTTTGKPTQLLGSWSADGVTMESHRHQVMEQSSIESMYFVLPDQTLLAGEFDQHLHRREAERFAEVLHHAA